MSANVMVVDSNPMPVISLKGMSPLASLKARRASIHLLTRDIEDDDSLRQKRNKKRKKYSRSQHPSVVSEGNDRPRTPKTHRRKTKSQMLLSSTTSS